MMEWCIKCAAHCSDICFKDYKNNALTSWRGKKTGDPEILDDASALRLHSICFLRDRSHSTRRCCRTADRCLGTRLTLTYLYLNDRRWFGEKQYLKSQTIFIFLLPLNVDHLIRDQQRQFCLPSILPPFFLFLRNFSDSCCIRKNFDQSFITEQDGEFFQYAPFSRSSTHWGEMPFQIGNLKQCCTQFS